MSLYVAHNALFFPQFPFFTNASIPKNSYHTKLSYISHSSRKSFSIDSSRPHSLSREKCKEKYSPNERFLIRELQLGRAEEVWKTLSKSKEVPLSSYIVNNMMQFLCEKKTPNGIQRAKELLKRLIEEHKVDLIDGFSLGRLALVSVQHGYALYAETVIRLMMKLGLQPHVKAWSAVVIQLGKSFNTIHLAFRLFHDICEYARGIECRNLIDKNPQTIEFDSRNPKDKNPQRISTEIDIINPNNKNTQTVSSIEIDSRKPKVKNPQTISSIGIDTRNSKEKNPQTISSIEIDTRNPKPKYPQTISSIEFDKKNPSNKNPQSNSIECKKPQTIPIDSKNPKPKYPQTISSIGVDSTNPKYKNPQTISSIEIDNKNPQTLSSIEIECKNPQTISSIGIDSKSPQTSSSFESFNGDSRPNSEEGINEFISAVNGNVFSEGGYNGKSSRDVDFENYSASMNLKSSRLFGSEKYGENSQVSKEEDSGKFSPNENFSHFADVNFENNKLGAEKYSSSKNSREVGFDKNYTFAEESLNGNEGSDDVEGSGSRSNANIRVIGGKCRNKSGSENYNPNDNSRPYAEVGFDINKVGPETYSSSKNFREGGFDKNYNFVNRRLSGNESSQDIEGGGSHRNANFGLIGEKCRNNVWPDTQAFNAMFNICAMIGDMEKANRMMKEMKAFDVQPDAFTYNILIKLSARIERRDLIPGVVEAMLMEKIEPCMSTFYSLVAAYVGLRDLKTAERLVHAMQEGRADICRVLRGKKFDVSGNCEENEGGDDDGDSDISSLLLLPRMYKPDTRIYNILMKGYVQKRRLKDVIWTLRAMQQSKDPDVRPDHITYTTAISAFVRMDMIKEAHALLQEMAMQGLNANHLTYNTLLNGYCVLQKMRKAKQLIEEMRDAGIVPDIVTYNTLINGCIEAMDNVSALEYFDEMKKAAVRPSEITYTILMKAFARAGQPKNATKVFDEMLRDPQIKVDLPAWNMLLESYCIAGMVETAKLVMQQMREKKIDPNASSYGSLVKGLNIARRPVETLDLWESIKDRIDLKLQNTNVQPLRPDKGLLDSFLEIFVRSAYFSKALEVLAFMEDYKFPVNKEKYRKMFRKYHSGIYTSKHKSLVRQNARLDKKRAAEAFKLWVGLPNVYHEI